VQSGLQQDGATPSFSQTGHPISTDLEGENTAAGHRVAENRAGKFSTTEAQTSFLMPLAPSKLGAETSDAAPAFPAGQDRAGPPPNEDENVAEPTGEKIPALASVWQLHNSFIFVQTRGGCLVIDQHAAHERILYEQLMDRLNGSKVSSQRLLFPATFHLPPEERVAAEQFSPLLEQAGFDIEQFSGNTVVVRSVPAIKNLGRVEEYFRDILRDLADEGGGSTGTRHQALARSLACRAAIKAGTELGQREMSDLIDKLFATDLPYADVHGRNTIVKLELDEINRRFGRS
jgi:DNA mismatch repair protein MutL